LSKYDKIRTRVNIDREREGEREGRDTRQIQWGVKYIIINSRIYINQYPT